MNARLLREAFGGQQGAIADALVRAGEGERGAGGGSSHARMCGRVDVPGLVRLV